MPRGRPKKNIKNEVMHELNEISNLVDLDLVNSTLKANGISKIDLSKKTLVNIGKWCLDGKSELEIRQNLELTGQEWAYLLKTCPAITVILQHSTAYADMIVGGTLLQTAIGGKIVKKKVPLKVHEYNENGKIIGEHYEMVEVEEKILLDTFAKYGAEDLGSEYGEKWWEEKITFFYPGHMMDIPQMFGTMDTIAPYGKILKPTSRRLSLLLTSHTGMSGAQWFMTALSLRVRTFRRIR